MEHLSPESLRQVLSLARPKMERFLGLSGRAHFWGDHLGTALCQGAALHYARHTLGLPVIARPGKPIRIKDLDIWFFFRARVRDMRQGYPPRHRMTLQVGEEGPLARIAGFERRIDILGRSIPAGAGQDGIGAVQDFLGSGSRTSSAGRLAEAACVVLEPAERLGELVWLNGRPLAALTPPGRSSSS